MGKRRERLVTNLMDEWTYYFLIDANNVLPVKLGINYRSLLPLRKNFLTAVSAQPDCDYSISPTCLRKGECSLRS